ncbi:MAG: EAL domain-containing protein [Betaproteobacteria bacterium]
MMPKLQSYSVTESLGKSLWSTVYKGFHKHTPDEPLVLKFIFNGEDKSRHLRQKIQRLKVLHDPRVCIPLDLIAEGDALIIIQPWFAGQTLNDWVNQTHRSLADFFTVACALAETLQVVHEAGITHGGIKPHNILVQSGSLTIHLTDFITPLDIRDVSHFIYDPDFVRGTLAYTSPEQTGRINHRVDFSTDLYSLGIVFYELLSGNLPFFSTDPLELIHSHLAEDAPRIHEINTTIPSQLGEIVAKLMLKQPEKRYQTPAGLLADLIRCRDDFLSTGNVLDFPIGQNDSNRRVTFISKMVGRREESDLIQHCYDEVVQGNFRSVFISGWSGIGKTRLIQELQQPLVSHRGYFTSGKFDQYQRNIPYSSLIQALRNLMRIFLTESDVQVTQWKHKILTALESNGQVITNVVPELGFIIGPQPDAVSLPPVEARNRFNNLFGRFLTCLASEENPLILFIDDLQWCDSATFDFLQNIFANHHDHPHLFLMGAYRHNEVDASHPLTKLLRNILEDQGPLAEIRVGPLSDDDCHEMVAYILDSTLDNTVNLSQFIAHLTEGNPLFVSESLAWLNAENLLHLNKQQQWQWDMNKIQETRMPATVVEMFSVKVNGLPSDTLHILSHCACMGNRFTALELLQVLEIDLITLFERLKPVLRLGLLLENKSDLQFVHDRVQEAVLKRLDEHVRTVMHWRIGTRLLEGVVIDSSIEAQDNLFTIAAHLNQGHPQVMDAATTYQLVNINYHAGNKALGALATDAANEFFHLAHSYLPSSSWDEAYELTYRIFQRLAKTDLMCGQYESSEALLNQLVEHAVSDLDKAEALAEQTTSLSSFGNFIQAIATANRGLAYFKESIPEDGVEANQRMHALMVKIETQGDVWSRILNTPFTQERKDKIELAFYSELIPDLYMTGLVPQLYLSAAQSTLHCLEGGMDESVIYSFSIMGLNLGEQEQFEQAFKYEDLARNLCARYPNTFGATKGINGIVWCNMHSRSHPAAIVDYAQSGIQFGKNCGDLYNAGLSYGPLMWCMQAQGKNLHLIEEKADECLLFSKKNQLSFSTALAEAVLAGWVAPMKVDCQPVPMEEKLAQWAAHNYVAASGSYFALLSFAQYYLGDYKAAAISLKAVENHLHGLTDNVLKRLWYVFRILNRLRFPEALSWSEVEAEISPLLQKITTWASFGPLLRPYLTLIHAEVACAQGHAREARNLYMDAIAEAEQQDYGLLSGHLYERLGDLMGNKEIGKASVYYAEARRIYHACRADNNSASMQSKDKGSLPRNMRRVDEQSIGLAYSEQDTLPNLDINYLMKSSLAMSAEIDLSQLLQKIMSVVLESSGAQHGYLLIKEQDELFIKAEKHVGKKSLPENHYYPLTHAHDICQEMVRYVFNTKEKIVLRDARAEGDFQNASEVKLLGLRSVMCLPVIKQGRMVGVLYLENRLSDGIFTPEKIGMTELLTSHAAISLENTYLLEETRIAAKIFESQEGMVITDANKIILRVNPAFTLITGYTAEDAVGQTPSILNSGRHDTDFYHAMWECINSTGAWYGEIWNRRKNGEIYPERLAITAVKDDNGIPTNYVASMTDITVSMAAAEEIKNLAFYDPLTHLPNRRLLVDRLNQALASSARNGRDGALLFLDLDHFKNLNDTLGHDIGDLLLKQVASRLIECVREGDTVARIGGDEYVVMLEELSEHPIEAAAQAEAVGKKILTALNLPYKLAIHEHHNTSSIGITLFSDQVAGIEEILKQADIAMYQAKKSGRNAQRFFDPQMQDSINARAYLERELRKAIGKNQFHLYYQVQVDVAGHAVGAEALVRWIHPERGIVDPVNFIALAEETGLIIPIGQWVLKTACTQLNAWQQDKLTCELTLSINVSAKEFRQADFVAQVQAAVTQHSINPMLLKLELTESILLEDIEGTIATMSALKEVGIRFSLDDFGTGYSSLQYLKRLPLYQLKIDQSFVQDIAVDTSDQAIVSTIIAMAHTLNLNVIAEGVETKEQQGLLFSSGCTHYQGYLFGRPTPIEQFQAALKGGVVFRNKVPPKG